LQLFVFFSFYIRYSRYLIDYRQGVCVYNDIISRIQLLTICYKRTFISNKDIGKEDWRVLIETIAVQETKDRRII